MRRLAVLVLALLAVLAAPFRASGEGETQELPSLLLTREVSSAYAEAGDWVTLSYTLANTTEYAITQLTLTDSLMGEVAHVDRLEPGEKKVVTIRARITSDCESVPVAKYTLGGKSRTRYLLALPIRVEKAALSARLEQADEVVRLTVTNDGNAPLYTIRASEPYLGDMGETVIALESGESAVFEHSARAGSYQCEVTAVTASGKDLTCQSNLLEVVEIPTASAMAEGLSLTAIQDRAGQIVVTLSNPGPETLRNITITEKNSGVSRQIDFVPVGDGTQVLWTDMAVGQSVFRFQVNWQGETLSAELTARARTARPRGGSSDIPDQNATAYRMIENPHTYQRMLVLTALALTAVLFAWWIAARRRRRAARKRRQRMRQARAKRRQHIQKSGEKAV